MNYAMDAAPGEWQLTDYVRKGIELLDNSNGFFMMVESGSRAIPSTTAPTVGCGSTNCFRRWSSSWTATSG